MPLTRTLFTVSAKEPIEHQWRRFNSSLSRIMTGRSACMRGCAADRLVEDSTTMGGNENIVEAMSGMDG